MTYMHLHLSLIMGKAYTAEYVVVYCSNYGPEIPPMHSGM